MAARSILMAVTRKRRNLIRIDRAARTVSRQVQSQAEMLKLLARRKQLIDRVQADFRADCERAR